MAIGALVGAAAGQGAGIGTAFGLQNDAQRHQLKIMKNQKQWLYDDLRAAGINPILASGASNVAGSAGIAGVSQGPDYGGAYRAGKIFKEQLGKARAEANTARTMADVASNDAVLVQSRADYYRSAQGQRELRLRFSNENIYGPLQGLGWAGVGAGAAGGLGNTGKDAIEKHLPEVESKFKKGWNSAKDLFDSMKSEGLFKPGPIDQWQKQSNEFWRKRRKER